MSDPAKARPAPADNTILVVDDEPGIRNVLSIALRDAGYDVAVAPDGREALESLREGPRALVLTDIKMPGMDGIELLRAVKQEFPDTEVVMMTGHGDMDFVVRSLRLEATDFVTKPVGDEALEVILGRARERRAMRLKLREYTENLEQLVKEKSRELLESERMAAVGQTVAGLAHAIKNIAGGLSGGLFVLRKGIDLDEREYLLNGWRMISSDVERVRNLAMDLLEYSRPSTRLEPCDPAALAADVVNFLEARAAEDEVALVLETGGAPESAVLDREAVRRCLLDLVINAIDACSVPGLAERRVILRTARANDGDGEVLFVVSDTGCGMDESTRSQVFRRFFSTKGSRGTGIGLMMTKRTVEEHGGRIDVVSRPGAGSTFTIRLPRRAAGTTPSPSSLHNSSAHKEDS